jgi:mRNA-degrading endonuclease RelE of RelBE toxin-antitoxin system
MSTHKWYLEVITQAREQLDDLPSKQRMAVFDSIRELLESDNPASVTGVKKLRGEQFKDMWRQRQGDYRIFFTAEHGTVTNFGFTYKGKVTIIEVVHRSKAYKP